MGRKLCTGLGSTGSDQTGAELWPLSGDLLSTPQEQFFQRDDADRTRQLVKSFLADDWTGTVSMKSV